MKTVLSWILGGALAASLAVHGWCWSRSCCSPMACLSAPAAGPAACLDGLELTPEQRARIAACESQCCAVEESEAQIRDAQVRLETALRATPVDAQLVRTLARELGERRAKMLADCVESILLVRGILTPEQAATLEACLRARE